MECRPHAGLAICSEMVWIISTISNTSGPSRFFARRRLEKKVELNETEKLALKKGIERTSTAFARRRTRNLPTHSANSRAVATASIQPSPRLGSL